MFEESVSVLCLPVVKAKLLTAWLDDNFIERRVHVRISRRIATIIWNEIDALAVVDAGRGYV